MKHHDFGWKTNPSNKNVPAHRHPNGGGWVAILVNKDILDEDQKKLSCCLDKISQNMIMMDLLDTKTSPNQIEIVLQSMSANLESIGKILPTIGKS